MAEESFVQFLMMVRDDQLQLSRYDQRNIAQLLLHAKNEGFDFTAQDAEAVIGRLEYDVICERDGDAFDGAARLWPYMWGRRYLGYLTDHVVRRYTDHELVKVGLGQSAPVPAGAAS
jgi:hypothetical protein